MTHPKRLTPPCPAPGDQLAEQARQRFEHLLAICQQRDLTFARFENGLAVLLALLATLLVRLYLARRHERLDLDPYLAAGPFRRGDTAAPRTLKTAYGPVVYARAQLIRGGGG